MSRYNRFSMIPKILKIRINFNSLMILNFRKLYEERLIIGIIKTFLGQPFLRYDIIHKIYLATYCCITGIIKTFYRTLLVSFKTFYRKTIAALLVSFNKFLVCLDTLQQTGLETTIDDITTSIVSLPFYLIITVWKVIYVICF